jgi:osmotically-inducible protein OsmY
MSTSNPKSPFELRAIRIDQRTLRVLAITAIVSWAVTAIATSPDPSFGDYSITSAVTSDLRHEPEVSLAAVEAQTSQGIVTLSGSVNDLQVKNRAVRIAQSVRGVLGVIDRITAAPGVRPDEDIRKNILTALLNDPATDSYQVSVSLHDAVATLSGTVGSWAESQLAQRVAEGVKGVKEVRNEILINYAEKRTDEEMAADIQAVLHWDTWLEGDPIEATVKDGHVSLTGKVGSAIAKLRAVSDAWGIGVQSVDDGDLKVVPFIGERREQKHELGMPSNSEIKKALAASFRNDPRLSRHPIDFTVEDGVVILSGTVGHLEAKTAAEQDARNIIGVLWVDNQLTVRPVINSPSDADVQKALKAALAWDPRVVGAQIEAAVINHTAYLGRDVDSLELKAEAQDVASWIKGVAVIRNHLKVEPDPSYFFYDQPYNDFVIWPPPPKSDAQIKKDIERAFFWSPFVHRDDIIVTVDDGVAKLTGTVGSWIGYEEADRDARKSSALSVINRLKVL